MTGRSPLATKLAAAAIAAALLPVALSLALRNPGEESPNRADAYGASSYSRSALGHAGKGGVLFPVIPAECGV
jgi:hypothetical protein